MCTQISFAQVTETSAAMAEGVKNALVLTLKNTDAKMAEDQWGKFMKKYKAKTKKVKKSNEWMSDDAEIEGVSTNTIDVYAAFKQTEGDAQAIVWFNLGGAYLNSKDHSDRYPAAKAMLMKFAAEVEKETVKEQLKAEEEALKELEKELDNQQKEQSKEEAKIEDYKKKISESEGNIQESVRAQKAQQELINQQRAKIEETKAYMKKIGAKQ